MLSRLALCLFLTSTFLGAESIRFNSPSQLPFLNKDVHRKILEGSEMGGGELRTMGPAPPLKGQPIPQDERDTWRVYSTSNMTKHDCYKVTDGRDNSFWHTRVNSSHVDVLPHSIVVDLREVKMVNALSMRPLPDADIGGAVAGHKVSISTDKNRDWNKKKWKLVAFGTWFGDEKDKFAGFEPQEAQFLRLDIISATNDTEYVRIVGIDVWATDLEDVTTTSSRDQGEWGLTVNFPLVPVGVFIDPIGGKVVSFSSYAHDSFGQGVTDHTTLTATWDPTTEEISERHVRKTHHDMFCPGMAFDVNGRMIISGGETADHVSIYDASKDDWSSVAPMKIPRGYQGSVLNANGDIFIVGGSWGPVGIDFGDRNGEIYNTEKNEWTKFDGIKSEHIQTSEDWEGEYRADNHIWLMTWRNNSLFHPGPAKNMHWIDTSGIGSVTPAGLRGIGDNYTDIHDRMCGVAAMYDAVEGKILSAGGAPSYNAKDGDGNVKDANATTNAFVITLDQPGKNASVEIAGDGGMHFPRSFGHAVILPNGETLIVGGQEQPRVFTEAAPQLTPEIYSPTTNKFTKMTPNTVPRGYHSFALLLRDATVLVGGGGLTIQLDVNHFDAQIFIPPYLFAENGERAKRPVITETSEASVYPGGNFTISTDSAVVSASLVRYGGATHSLNNDQRRMPLTLHEAGMENKYFVQIPADGGVALPGYYMLFVMDAAGVPSEAKNVQILISPEYQH
ncbi:hypothetical protein ACLMJK_005597 [Lecanora helva]